MRIGEATSAPPIATLAGLRKSSNMGPDPGRAFRGRPPVQERRKNHRERIAGPIKLIIDAARCTAAAHLGQVLAEGRQIAVAQSAGVAQELWLGFHAFEAGGARKWERQLVVVEHVKDQYVVTAVR